MESIKELTSFLMQHEGKKIQVNRAQMGEIVKIISLMLYTKPESTALLITHGKQVFESMKEHLSQEEE